MKIGILLTKRKPTDGGGYTITKDLFDSITKLYPKKNFILSSGEKKIIIFKEFYKKVVSNTL